MTVAYTLIKQLLFILKEDAFYKDMELVAAYENEIKPYPVTKPILAFAIQSQKIGDRLIDVAADGTQTLSHRRPIETTCKVSIFVPYESGTREPYRIADHLYSFLLFQGSLDAPDCRYADCNYVRDCGALVLHTQFTVRSEQAE